MLTHSSLKRRVKAAVRLEARDNSRTQVHQPKGNDCTRSSGSSMNCMNYGNGSSNTSSSSITPRNNDNIM